MSISSEFKKFIVRGNFVDLAIGFTVGAAFTTVVKSAVQDLIMPFVGLATGKVDFSQKFIVLREGTPGVEYNTIEEADKAGAITLNYGAFINNCISLILVGIVMFLVLRMINRMHDAMEEEADGSKPADDEPSNKKCPFCMATIAYKAVRCPSCTSELRGFRERRDKRGIAENEMGAATEKSSAES